MKNKKSLLSLLMAILVTLLGMAAGVYFNSPDPAVQITLPQKTDGESIDMEDIRRENIRILEAVTVDESNVLNLVQQMSRPLEYHFRSENTVYYGDKSAVTAAEGYVKGDISKITHMENGEPSVHIVMSSESIYMWQEGTRRYESFGKGGFSHDDMAFTPSYEALTGYETILEADTEVVGDDFYINITAKQAGSDITERFVLSVATGLVSQVSYFDGDELISRVTLELLGTDEIPTSTFLLPDNTEPT